MSKYMKLAANLFKIFICTLIAIFIGSCLMILVYCLPLKRMRYNVEKSVNLLEVEENSVWWSYPYSSAHVDKGTDNVMLNIATFQKSENIIDDALVNRWYSHPDYTPIENIKMSLEDMIEERYVSGYARYWNGWLIFLKPLLTIFDFASIRVINMSAQMLLLSFVSILFYKKLGIKYMPGFLAAIIILNPASTSICLQLSQIYYISLIMTLIILKYNIEIEQKGCYYLFFMIIGEMVAFFDFLTYPLVAWGIPIITYILLQEEMPIAHYLKRICVLSLSWGWGYIGMWSGKWLVTTLLTDYDVISTAIRSIRFRTNGIWGGLSKPITVFNSIDINFKQLMEPSTIFMLISLCVIIIALFLSNYASIEMHVSRTIILLCISIVPFIWYSIMKNHSIIHNWMTYKNLALTVYGGISILMLNINLKEVR